jgi:hypothetical protein
LTAEQALDIAVDFASARTANTIEILNQLFQVLESRIETQMHGVKLESLTPLEEMFMGLNADIEWVTDENITRQETYPIFVRIALGKLDVNAGIITFCDQMCAKRDFYLEVVQGLTKALTEEIVEISAVPPATNEEA